jgi:hypothetical protein
MYALSSGILKREVTAVGNNLVRWGSGAYAHGEGKEWHRTEAAAQAKAKDMAAKKLASLDKQRKKLETIAANGATIKEPK